MRGGLGFFLTKALLRRNVHGLGVGRLLFHSEVTMSFLARAACCVLSFATLLVASPSRACDCAPPPAAPEALAAAAAVFRGTVVGIGRAVDSKILVVFEVEAVWKGPQEEVLEVSTAENEALCGFGFEMGREYLVFAFGEAPDLLTNICTRTALSSEGDADALGPPLWVRGDPQSFQRGDVDSDGNLGMSDAVHLLGHLFLGEEAPSCQDAADANDDAVLDLGDAVHVLSFLFLGGPPPGPPFPACGPDPTADPLGCAQEGGCASARAD